jgi:serine/threonine protein phosphatase 1
MLIGLPERHISSSIPDGLDLFVIGDIHGRSEALGMCLDTISGTQTASGSTRAIVFLGDLIDRGPDSLGAVRMALSAKNIVDIVRFLPGNHELMMLEVLDGRSPEKWLMNGGSTVMSEVSGEWSLQRGACAEALKQIFPMDYVDKIRNAPSHLTMGDLILVHAGLHPHEDPEEHLDRKRPLLSDTHWASIRHPFLSWRGGWDHDGRRYFWGDKAVIHGHTPAVRECLKEKPEALEICDGFDDYRAVCLDAGASTRNQIGWARFRRESGKTHMQIHASVVL